MKANRFLILAALLLPGTVFGASQSVLSPPGNFGGGLNIKTIPSDIEDTESPDMQNMINGLNGESSKRNGSIRYISQAISSNPINSIFRVYASSGPNTIKGLLVTTKDGIFYSSNDVLPQWIQVSSGLVPNQTFEGVLMQNKLIMAGDKKTDPLLSFNIQTSSLTTLLAADPSTTAIVIRAAHLLNSRNFLIAANGADITAGTTYYPSRLWYSLVAIPSSMTASRFIDVKADDGEEITGLGEMNHYVHIFKQTSIAELSFNILNLSSLGGDQTLTTIVYGFGLAAPRTLANIGDFYIFGAKDGLRIWDGGRRSRLQLEQESKQISTPIQPIIDRLIHAGTYQKSVGKYYPKKQWYVFSYEDPEKAPHGKLNSVMVFDILLGQWFPFKNWLAKSFETEDGPGDTGDLVYGDSQDGFVYFADQITSPDDARKELYINSCDRASDWNRGQPDNTFVKEGTGALKLTLPTALLYSSAAFMSILNFSEWPDGSKIIKTTPTSDMLSFKVYTTSPSNIASLRIDLEVNGTNGDFDVNFTSVTIASAAFVTAVTTWTTVEIALSSFPVIREWVDISSEALPFANSPTYYGIRFVATGTGGGNLYIDDVRLVQGTDNPLNAYRFTKQFNFGSAADKTFLELFLNTAVSADSQFTIDVFNNFGQFTKTIAISGLFNKELFVAGYAGVNNITKLNSISFAVLASTIATDKSYFAVRPLVADDTYVYGGDQFNNRILKFNKSNFSTIVASAGSLGNQTTNFNLIYQMAVDDTFLYVCDFQNQRVQVLNKTDLSYVQSFGSLGMMTTSFHNPTGVAVDDTYLYVGSDGNSQLMKLTKSTGAFVASVALNLNTVGDTTLAVDDKYIYDAFNTVTPDNLIDLDVVLEKRLKSSLEVVTKVTLRPKNVVALSTYSLLGDIAITDDYIYVSFTDDINGNGGYYIQKRLKSDFSLVKEYKGSRRHFAVAANGLAYKAKRKTIISNLGFTGAYIQLRFAEDDLDNNMKLYNQSFKLVPQEVRP